MSDTKANAMTKPQLFFLYVLAMLLPCFVVWATFSIWLALPSIKIAEFIFTGWMPQVVAGFHFSASEATVLTHFGEVKGQLVSAQQAGYQMGFPLNTRILSYSLPFYAALHFATPQRNSMTNFIYGALLLFILLIFSIICVVLKDLMIGLGPQFYQMDVALLPPPQVVALLFQLSTLIIPPLGSSSLTGDTGIH